MRLSQLICAAIVCFLPFHSIAAEELDVPWYAAVSMFHFPRLYAADLGDTATSLLPAIMNSSAEYVLIDFYAPWCPHCQHFAPDYERLALTIQQSNAMEGATAKLRILVGTVDCVQHVATCNAWGVEGFPTLIWGHRTDWLSKNVSKLEQVDVNPRSAEGVAQWINERVHIHLDTSKVSRKDIVKLLHSLPVQSSASSALSSHSRSSTVDTWDVQLAAALFIHEALAQHPFPMDDDNGNAEKENSRTHYDKGHGVKIDSQHALLGFIKLLADRFPEPVSNAKSAAKPCGNSLMALHRQLESNWTKLGQVMSSQNGDRLLFTDTEQVEREWTLCNSDWQSYSRGWGSCRGTWPGKRGLTCGLWSMFHTIVARGEDQNALDDTHTIRAALWHFFDCDECREHFFQIPLREDKIQTRHSAQIWWWQAHNLVNQRVQKLEQQYEDGDPEFPKIQWPSAIQCPACRQPSGASSFLQLKKEGESSDWNLDEVVGFLKHFYDVPR